MSQLDKDIEFLPAQVPEFGDVNFSNTRYDMVLETGLDTTFFLSVYTDSRASLDDTLPTENGDVRGWWGDELLGVETGSKAWLYSERGKLDIGNIEKIRTEMVVAVTRQMINAGLIDEVDITYTREESGITWNVKLYRSTDTNVFLQYQQLWDGQIAKVTKEVI